MDFNGLDFVFIKKYCIRRNGKDLFHFSWYTSLDKTFRLFFTTIDDGLDYLLINNAEVKRRADRLIKHTPDELLDKKTFEFTDFLLTIKSLEPYYYPEEQLDKNGRYSFNLSAMLKQIREAKILRGEIIEQFELGVPYSKDHNRIGWLKLLNYIKNSLAVHDLVENLEYTQVTRQQFEQFVAKQEAT